MGQREQSDAIHTAFIKSLSEQGMELSNMESFSSSIENKDLSAIFSSWASSNREIYYHKNIGFINVHVRAEPPGFWGITKSIEDDFEFIRRELNIACLYILLVSRKDGKGANGYILKDLKSEPIKNKPSEQKTQFKINEKSNLNESKKILSLKKVAEKLLSYVAK